MKCTFVFLMITCSVFSQTHHLSGAEFTWAIFHPFAAIKVKKTYKKCLPFYNGAKTDPALDTYENGGKTDAFRHVFFFAAFAQKIKTKKVRKLGKAHEKSNYRDFKKNRTEQGELPDSLSTVMDLYNNETGIKLGNENKNLTIDELKKKVLDALQKGEALYFLRDRVGNYINCDSKIIDMAQYSGKWSIPKCLITTNQ